MESKGKLSTFNDKETMKVEKNKHGYKELTKEIEQHQW